MPRFSTNLKLCKDGAVDFTDTDIYDESQNYYHGTNIAGIISNGLKNIDYCVYILKIYSTKHEVDRFNHLKAFRYAISKKVDLINYSSSGVGYNVMEAYLVRIMRIKNIKFVCAAGNDSLNLDKGCIAYPGCYNGVISVGNLNKNKTIARTSNYGKIVTAWQVGDHICANNVCLSGTSQATAVQTVVEAIKLSKEK